MRRALVLLLWAVPAAAEVHGAVGVGGTLRIDAPSLGVSAAAELWPGGLWGLRLDLHRLDGALLVEGSVARALGATWHHLVLAAHAGAGADLEHSGVSLSAGLATDLGLGLGPLALMTDLSLHVVVWDGRRDGIITGTIGLGAMF